MFKRKGDVSMNVIVMTAIALIVLVVVIAIFTGRMGSYNKQLNSAQKCGEGLGGKCLDAATCEQKGGVVIGYGADVGCNSNQVCCKGAKS